jgi:hypothetical protein
MPKFLLLRGERYPVFLLAEQRKIMDSETNETKNNELPPEWQLLPPKERRRTTLEYCDNYMRIRSTLTHRFDWKRMKLVLVKKGEAHG